MGRNVKMFRKDTPLDAFAQHLAGGKKYRTKEAFFGVRALWE